MSKQVVSDCRSGKDFVRFAATHGAVIRSGHGLSGGVST